MSDVKQGARKDRAHRRDHFFPFRALRGLGEFGTDCEDIGTFFVGNSTDAFELCGVSAKPNMPGSFGGGLNRAGPALRHPDVRLHDDGKTQLMGLTD
jgi:hypothetical protein